jgi:prolyl 4-hydroxylase
VNTNSDNLDNSLVDFNIRTSYVAWLPKYDKVVKKIVLKVCKLTKMNFKNVENLQVVKYEKGGFYKTHYDDVITKKNENRTYRVFTFLIYLNDDYTGGQTKFPKINFTVQPRKNSAVFFHNLDDSKRYFNKYSLHGGLPVKDGTKYVANIWIHDSEWIEDTK